MRENRDEEAEARFAQLERDLRDLRAALHRNTAVIEALAAENRALATWLGATSRSTEEIARSRIWRALASVGGVLLWVSRLGRGERSDTSSVPDAYRRWITAFEGRDQFAIRKQTEGFAYRPLISVVVPVVHSESEGLAGTVASVVLQSYPDWELCVSGRGPARRLFSKPPPQPVRSLWMAQDPFPAGVGLASGEFIVLLLPGATMAPDALFHFVELLNREPATDLAYADEDLIARSGERRQPFFKPSWSPDLLLSMNYIGDTFLVRRSLAAEAGAHDPYDLLLRITADTSRVRRVPRVLFHLSAGLGRSPDAERRALHDHLLRVHPGAWTEPDADHRRWRVRYPLPREGRVSIIIPSAGKVDLLEANLADLESKTHYPHYEIVVADNSRGEELQRFVRSSSSGNRTLRYLDYRHTAFNFASICNAAARTCNSPFLVFLNDDTRPIAPGWLGAMVELGARPEVGAVGARLLFPNGTIQHAGIVLGIYRRCGHLFKGLDAAQDHYFGLDRVIRNVSAVTGACLLVRADVFREAGGFDAECFPVDGNDVDLCLRIGAKGYRVLYTPYAELYHYESLSRGTVDRRTHPSEIQEFSRRWADIILDDPFYSPNLTRSGVDCSPRILGE